MMKFRKAISHKKLVQSIVILVLMCSFQSYFIGVYFLSSNSFSDMYACVDVLFILFQRKACGEDVIHAVVEGYQWNDTYLINHGQDEIMEYFIVKCSNLENDYQNKVITAQPKYLGDSMVFLNKLEKGNFCEEIFSDGDGFTIPTVTPTKCMEFAGGITLLGLTNIFSTTYKVC